MPQHSPIVTAEADAASEAAPTGRHLLLTLAGCPAGRLDDRVGLEALVRAAAEATGATVLQVVGHQFAPQGVTVIALLAESHASLHTYPERGLAFWDCFTCGPACDPAASIPVLQGALRPARLAQRTVVRSGTIHRRDAEQ
jgi:S-adenosylmethionine decarboxylase proenzyme